MHVIWHAQFHAGVPAGAVEHEHNPLRGTRSYLAGELRELHLKEGYADAGRQMADGPS
ncbi:MAG TPA: hypothetical protein VGP82_17905 [Ktedonobacterales bacterium]|jgi:hypothetical protein|nr:hypothetical protein [Ktedonobacterales bacterium]